MATSLSILEKLEKRYPVEPAKEADVPQILEVFNEVWTKYKGKSKSEKKGIITRNQMLYLRRYLENPYSNGFESIMVARNGIEIIGFTGTMDFDLCYRGKMFPATCTVDQAVLPSYQAKGLGYLLLKRHYERDVIAIAGDLNPEAQRMHKSMKVREISNCYVMRRWTRPADLFKKYKQNSLSIEKNANIDSRFDQLWLAARNCYEIVGVRNQAVLKWRYDNLPTRDFNIFTLNHGKELVGYIVTTMGKFKRIANKGILVDYLFGSITQGDISKFISVVLSHLARRGAICVEVVVTHARLVKTFKELGYFATEEKPHFVVYNNAISRDKADLYDGRNWLLTFGDSDFYFTR